MNVKTVLHFNYENLKRKRKLQDFENIFNNMLIKILRYNFFYTARMYLLVYAFSQAPFFNSHLI